MHDGEPAGPGIGGGGLVRWRLDLGYDGTAFSGWARQPGMRTVQGVLEDALGRVLRLAAVSVTVAGRTDAGVHAIGQVAHADLPPEVAEVDLTRRLNGVLPDDVRVRSARVAPERFDARFAALARVYRYRVTDGVPDPLRQHDTLAWSRPLDQVAMQSAAQRLLGEHDFAAYCRPRAGATTVRRLLRLDVERRDDLVTVTVEADAFCHNMVRAIVGALLAVGEGRRPVHWPGQVLRAGVRDSDVTVAPAHGLTLIEVRYPAVADLAARAQAARVRREIG
jgi:tRNA pseudouridine38-40 synthase